MLIAAPRSGTTWASNWLTTDNSVCLHDPLSRVHYSDWDFIRCNKTLGISDTGIAVFDKFVNLHPARKVILHRDRREIDSSLNSLGVPSLTNIWDGALDKIEGMHVHWLDIFNNPKPIYEFLLQKEFDAERHALLKEIEMQPKWSGLTINKEVTRKIVNEIMESMQ